MAKITTPLTDKQIKAAKPIAKDYVLTDGNGLQLRVRTNGKYWLTQVLDEWKEDGKDPSDYLKTLTRQAQNRPYAECNFLKKPFLDACDKKGLIKL